MKKIGLIILLALALTAGFAQDFTAMYKFDNNGNVLSFAYNGNSILGLTMSDIQKVGVVSWSKKSNFGAVHWPVGTNNTFDSGKYIGFEMDADPGYTFTVTNIAFGMSRSQNGGMRRAQWRGSSSKMNPGDEYTTILPGCSCCWGMETNADGVMEVTQFGQDLTMSGLNLSLAGNANYEEISACGFRLYMYDAQTADGDSGLWSSLTITGTIIPPTGDPVFSVAPAALTGLTYPEGTGPSHPLSLTVGGANLDNHTIRVTTPPNFAISNEFEPAPNPLSFENLTGNVQIPIYVNLVAGLPVGSYSSQITVEYIKSGNTVETKYVDVSGTVTAAPQNWYLIDFEGALDTKPYDRSGQMYFSDREWTLDRVLIETDPANVINGSRSALLRGGGDPSSMIMENLKSCGAGTISFNARSLGNDPQASWVVKYCHTEEYPGAPTQVWHSLGTFSATTGGGIHTFGPNITKEQIRICIERTSVGPDIIVDDIKITDYCDFYNGEPKTVGTDMQNTVTIIGGHGNYDVPANGFSPDPIPIEGFTQTFHNFISLMGNKPSWTIVTAVPVMNPAYTYWTAYNDGLRWEYYEMESGTFSFTIYNPLSKISGSIIGTELAIGYTEKAPTVPVTLSHFSATMTAENYVNLKWVSQTETGLMGYNVLRSADEDLSTARQICALIEATNTSQAQTYTYLDKDLVEDGTYYYWLQSVETDGSTNFHGPASVIFSITGDDGSPSIPKVTKLEDAYPNPFNPNTTLRYQLESPGKVKIDIYNTRGQIVRSFERSHDDAGYYSILWDGCDGSGRALASGVYLYRMTSGQYSGVKKMVLQK